MRCHTRGPVSLFFLLSATIALASSAARAAGQTIPVAQLPSVGQTIEQSLANNESHDWQIALAANEYFELAVEPNGVALGVSDEWPNVRVTAPDGVVLYESNQPNITLSIDVGPRMVASFIAGRPGQYRLRITARHQNTLRVPYRLWVERRSPAVDEDRQRIAAHRLWSDGMRLFLQGTRDARSASLDRFEKARRLLAAIGDDEGEAITLGTIGMAWYQLSDSAKGSAAAAAALEIWRRLQRQLEQGIMLSDLGLLAYLSYDHPRARARYEEALPYLESAGNPGADATTLVRLGWIEYAAGEMSRVIDLNQRALALWRQAGDFGGESVSLNDLGRAYVELGEVSLALEVLRQALSTRSVEHSPRGAAVVLMRIGQVYLSVADWQQALEAFQQALVLARRAHDARNEASVGANLGLVYSRIGDSEEARRYLVPALELSRKIAMRNVEANVLDVLGVEAYLSGDLASSRSHFLQALAIQTAITDVRGQAATLRYLATTQLALGLQRDALVSIQSSLEKSKTGAVYASGLATLASVHDALGDTAQAQATYQEALDAARQIRARDQEASILALYGRFEAKRGRYAEARELLEQALATHESLRGLLADPDQRMNYSSRSMTPYEVYIDVLMALERQSPGAGHAAQAFRTAERARARGLLELLATSSVDIRRGVDAGLVERERALRWNINAKAAIQTALLADRRDARRLRVVEQEIADLSRSWRETTTRIRQQSPGYAELAEPQPLNAAEVGALLDHDTVLLEFAPGGSGTWLFAVTSDRFESFALPPRQAIEDAAREVRRVLTSRQPVAGETADRRYARIARAEAGLGDRTRALSDLVLDPIRSRLQSDWRGKRLAIVALGALEYVPFGALPLPGGRNRAPLVTAHEIVTLPSASSLTFLRREVAGRPTGPTTIAVFADPVFDADDPRVTKRRGDRAAAARSSPVSIRSRPDSSESSSSPLATRALEPFLADGTRSSLARLPFSRGEALAVSSQVPRASYLLATDFDASLALATSGRLNDYRIVHFATHGLINTTRPELSGLALSLVDPEGRPRDGFLRLNTIYNLRLSADLVVLSACQSALGKEVAGEGLVGLTRGFMYAGARRVIASLWQVSDVATAELMKKFYAGMLQRHLPAAAALRNAQLEMSSDPRWTSPYFWAGFVLQGDWTN